jgi:hypothetical protein
MLREKKNCRKKERPSKHRSTCVRKQCAQRNPHKQNTSFSLFIAQALKTRRRRVNKRKWRHIFSVQKHVAWGFIISALRNLAFLSLANKTMRSNMYLSQIKTRVIIFSPHSRSCSTVSSIYQPSNILQKICNRTQKKTKTKLSIIKS